MMDSVREAWVKYTASWQSAEVAEKMFEAWLESVKQEARDENR